MEQGQKTGGKPESCENIDGLSAKMLMAILKFIPTSTLNSSCRNVNRKWNEISSSLLRHRPETLLKFFLGSNGTFLLSKMPLEFKGVVEKESYEALDEEEEDLEDYKTLEEFMDCYKNSKSFPFARFSFKKFYDGGDHLKTFMTTFGSKILSININPPENEKHIQLLRQLLTEYCPDLQELIFDEFLGTWEDNTTKYSGNLKLFTEEDKINSFPNLKTVHLSRYYKKYLGVVEDILRAGSSLKEIRGYWSESCLFGSNRSITVEDIQLLNRIGKLDLIKSLNLGGDKLAAHCKKFPGQLMNLSKIQVDAGDMNMNVFIEYSKDSLKELVVLRSGYTIPEVNWSLIPNLQKLYLPVNENPRTFFPAGENIILKDLKELEIENTYAAKNSSSSPVPFSNVKILKLKFHLYSCEFMEDLCVMFPNVTCLDLRYVRNFADVGHLVWKNMKQLMTLCIHIPKNEPDFDEEDLDFYFEKPEKNPYEFPTKLDSCFTGYSEEICMELKDQFEGVAQVSEDELLQYNREKPSIVDLKYLTNLRIRYAVFQNFNWPLTEIKSQQKEMAQNLKESVSHVSRLFAFQQMPNLQLMIDTEIRECH